MIVRVRLKFCRSILHISLLMLSLPHLIHTQRQNKAMQGQFESVDSFGEAINVFNLTTISPIEETATKVSVETIDTLLEALDGAASAIDGQHFSTGILGDLTTQRVPGKNEL